MSGRRSSIGAAKNGTPANSTPSSQRAPPGAATSGAGTRYQKRKKMSTGGDETEEPVKDNWAEMKTMMSGLSIQMSSIATDIGAIKKELGEQIKQGNKEIRELKKRMDDNDANFEDKVVAIVSRLPGCAGGPSTQDGSHGPVPGPSGGSSGPGSYAERLAQGVS